MRISFSKWPRVAATPAAMASASLRISTEAFNPPRPSTPHKAAEHAAQSGCEREAFDLLQVWRFLHDPVANHAREAHPHAVNLPLARDLEDLFPDQFGDLVAGHRPERVGIVGLFGKDPDRADERIVLHHSYRDLPGRQDADCLPHVNSPLPKRQGQEACPTGLSY